jgi:hypothetical protein
MIASKRGLPAAIFVTSHWFAFLKSAKLSYPSPTSINVFVLKTFGTYANSLERSRS